MEPNSAPKLPSIRPELPFEFTSQAGISVETYSNVWELAYLGKGRKIDITWLQSFPETSELKYVLLDTLIYYAETKSASTVSTITTSLKQAFPKDFSQLAEFEKVWHVLKGSTKKTLSGFLNSSIKLNHRLLEKHHKLACKYSYKQNFNGLHPTKGRLTDYEYDSILENLRIKCRSIPNKPPEDFDYYIKASEKNNSFINLKNIVAYRLLIQLARRPKQIVMLKWSDILPVGISFNDINVHDEPINTGIKTFHVRCFKIKQSNQDFNFRLTPEKWSIPLTESFSALLLKYREIYYKGLSLAINECRANLSAEQCQALINHCPVIPDIKIFTADFSNHEIIDSILHERSQLFHSSENIFKNAEKSYGKGLSERTGQVVGTNNRLRHTWLCNAALNGHSLADICKITNVTEPGARMYLQLSLKERQYIDTNYAANQLLRDAFNPKPSINSEDIPVGNEIDIFGVEKEPTNCKVCAHKSNLTRPLPCYGCPNFRPLLDANHTVILEQAIAKREFIKTYSSNFKKSGSSEKLDKIIANIKLTIAICIEIKLNNAKLNK
jgi:hypothetical protein